MTLTYLVSALFTTSMYKQDAQEQPFLDRQQNRWTTADFGGVLWTSEGLFELETDAGELVWTEKNEGCRRGGSA